MDRRTALKQLSFFSLSPLIGSPLREATGYNTRFAFGKPTLTVILHGSFAVIVPMAPNAKYIQLIAPDISPTHIYTAGDKFKPGSPHPYGSKLRAGATYILDGVDPQARVIDPGTAAHVAAISSNDAGIGNIDPNHKTFCDIVLPMPQNIIPLNPRLRKDGQLWFKKAPPNFKQPDDLPLTVALSYGEVTGMPSFSVLGEAQPVWPTATTTLNGQGNYTLHLRAEPRSCPPPHPNHFALLLKLIPPLDTTLQLSVPGEIFSSPNPPVDPDLDPNEERTLQELLFLETRARSNESPNRLCPRATEVMDCQTIVVTRP